MKKKRENKVERPILQFSVLCDGIATPQEVNNKPVFIGVFSSLLRPMIIPQFFIANRWINGLGEHAQIIKILDPELKEIASAGEQKFTLPSKVSPADIFNAFVNLNFPKAGVYWIKIELDGKIAMSYPLPVFEGR
jgi:hypothetical protein